MSQIEVKMDIKIYCFAVLFSVIVSFDSGYGLKCHLCKATDTVSCSKEDRSTWPVDVCAPNEDKCVFYEFETISSKGIPLGKRIQRRCTSRADYCDFIEKTTNLLLESSRFPGTTIRQTQCKFCDTELCN